MHGGHVPGTAGMRRSSGGRDARAAGKSKAKELQGMEEGREKRQDREDVDLGDAQELGGVHVVPVSEFVG